MSGDSQRTDEPDPIDDDFVIEDLGGKGDDLEPLFAAPTPPTPAGKVASGSGRPAVAPGAADAGPVDPDDMLFEDHTLGLQPTERFESGRGFAEQAASQWSGDGLDLGDGDGDIGVPPVDEAVEAAAANAIAAAESTFNSELGSLLASEEEFALDSESELELVDGAVPTDGIDEFEQSGPFVLDDGEGAWQQADESVVPAGAAETVNASDAEPLADEAGEATVELEGLSALAPVADEPVEPGWEPLPAANVDELAEVDELARTDEVDGDEAGELVAVGGGDRSLSFDTEQLPRVVRAPVLIGARPPMRRSMRALLSMAAALLLCSAAVTVLCQPRWFGGAVEPERVQVVQVDRPLVVVAVPTPRLPETVLAVAPPIPVPAPATSVEPPVAEPAPVPTVSPVAVAVVAPTESQRAPLPPANAEPTPRDPLPDVAIAPAPAITSPENGVASSPEPQAVAPAVPPSVAVVAEPWPLTNALVAGGVVTSPTKLVRVSENLMVGERDSSPRVGSPVDGVLPGSRAFAQLRNGNYFIGSIKCAGVDSVTLRVGTGEVTLATAEIARLTELGSADYDELQKATSGFVRLTNNNRLVGGILSKIADDHVVLEFRSNRVMLPRSAIGEIVQGEGDAAIRLDVTREEDEWLRQLAERQLGTGAPPAAALPRAPAVPKPPTDRAGADVGAQATPPPNGRPR